MPGGVGETGLDTVSSSSFFSDGVFSAVDSSEGRPVGTRSLDSRSISTVLDLNIGVGWWTMFLPRYAEVDRRGTEDGGEKDRVGLEEIYRQCRSGSSGGCGSGVLWVQK